MPTNGLELLMALIGQGGADLRSIALGMALPQLPKIAQQLTKSSYPPDAQQGPPDMGALGQGGTPGIEGGAGAGGIPPQLLPLLALAQRSAQQGAAPPGTRPPAPPVNPMGRVVPMDQPA